MYVGRTRQTDSSLPIVDMARAMSDHDSCLQRTNDGWKCVLAMRTAFWSGLLDLLSYNRHLEAQRGMAESHGGGS